MACMRKIEKPSPTESPLLFEFDPKPAEEMLTALGGLPLVVQAFRSLGLPGSVKQHLVVKERQRGYDEATFVESFVILNAAGGECLDDFERLRADPGLGQLIGHEVPSPEAARKFLYAFHEEEKLQQAKQQRLPDQIAYIPTESEALEGLGKAENRSDPAIGFMLSGADILGSGHHDLSRAAKQKSPAPLRRAACLSADAGGV